jgi:hypothetical protein
LKPQQVVYELTRFLDDPRYAGFGVADGQRFPRTVPQMRNTRSWRVQRIAGTWQPLRIVGPVRDFVDLTGIMGSFVFSQRAVDALRDLLEANGELLPLKCSTGQYFAYNLTTVADVLSWKESEIKWLKKPVTAFSIERFVLKPRKLEGLEVFRLPEKPSETFVTEQFVHRAQSAGLKGFRFIRVWPLPPDVSWRDVAKRELRKHHREGLPEGRSLKGNSVLIRLPLSGTKLKASEDRRINEVEEAIEKVLFVPDSAVPPVGTIERVDFGTLGECRILLSCPDAGALVDFLHPTIRAIKWPQGISVVKRYGNFADTAAREEDVEI